MGKHEKLLDKILYGRSDTNIGFDELCNLLERLGFEQRQRGSHRIFRKAGVEEKINLQEDSGHAKPYQVGQVRAILLRYRLMERTDV